MGSVLWLLMGTQKLLLHIVVSLLSFAALLMVLLLINPRDKPLVYIYIPIILASIAIFALLRVFTSILTMSKRTSLISSSTLTFSLMLLLVLSGTGQLSWSDIILTVTLSVVGVFYFYRTWA
jgi:hypothetical protein